MDAPVLVHINQPTKFGMSSFIHSNKNGSPDQ